MSARLQEQFAITDAKPGPVQVVIGLMGPPGGGKTYSALRLASGIHRARGGPIVFIDTENDRAKKYAADFDFKHLSLRPPFRPLRYLAAVEQAAKLNPCAIIIDSMSDEHEGQGGVLDYHEEEIDKFLGDQKDNWARREAQSQRGWIKPKRERLAMIHGFLQLPAKTPLILCFRSREKTAQRKDDRGKTVIEKIGWTPIAPAEIVYSCDIVCLLPPNAEGSPTWSSDKAGEDFMLKLPKYAQPAFERPGPLNEDMGEMLARWALGEDIRAARPSPSPARFVFRLTNSKGATAETENGVKWADTLCGWIAKDAAKAWAANEAHVAAAERAGHEVLASRVWAEAARRGAARAEGAGAGLASSDDDALLGEAPASSTKEDA